MIRISVLCPAEIAFRRFMPALLQCPEFEYVGVGMHRREKAEQFLQKYPGRLYESYQQVIDDESIDAVYIPLPPALHFEWAEKALKAGKHVLLEKPFTCSLRDTETLLNADEKLAVHENYMFVFHDQIRGVKQIIDSGEIGDVRLYRLSFGFPLRPEGDFRYSRAMGGGALMDAGGYCLKAAGMLLGGSGRVISASSGFDPRFDADLYGAGTMADDHGTAVQFSFGMDNNYKCSLEVWGSRGTLTTGRFFTAPAGFVPRAVIEKNGTCTETELPADDTFLKSIRYFRDCISDQALREESRREIRLQAERVEAFRRLAGHEVRQ